MEPFVEHVRRRVPGEGPTSCWKAFAATATTDVVYVTALWEVSAPSGLILSYGISTCSASYVQAAESDFEAEISSLHVK